MQTSTLVLQDTSLLMSPSPKAAPAQAEPLLPRVAAGEFGAVDLCIKRYGGLVWSAARKFLGQAADAEDAVQEIFADLWTKAARFNPSAGSESAWVMMVTRRRLIDRVRHDSRRVQPSVLDAEPQEGGDRLGAADREDLARARAAMQSLKPEERQVLELVLTAGLSHRAACPTS